MSLSSEIARHRPEVNRTLSEVTCSGGSNRGPVNEKVSAGHGQRRFFHHFPSPLFVIIAGNQGETIRLQLSWKMVWFIVGLVAVVLSALSITSFFAISLLHENSSMSSELEPLREKLRASIEETASIRDESDQQLTLLSLKVTQLELDNILQSEAVIKEKPKSHPSRGGHLATQEGEDSSAGHGDYDYSSADGSVMTSSENGGDVTFQSLPKIFLRTGDKVKKIMNPVFRLGDKVRKARPQADVEVGASVRAVPATDEDGRRLVTVEQFSLGILRACSRPDCDGGGYRAAFSPALLPSNNENILGREVHRAWPTTSAGSAGTAPGYEPG